MFHLRLIALLAFFYLAVVSGCSKSDIRTGPAPPPVSFCHFQRLGKEIRWFYADLNDMFFGIDYYPELEERYGRGPYAP